MLLVLQILWLHLAAVTLGAEGHARMVATGSVVGRTHGRSLPVRAERARGRAIRPALLVQCAALLLMLQLGLWDRVPGFFRLTPPAALAHSFWFGEAFRLYVAVLLIAPPALVLGLIFPRLLADPQCRQEGNGHLAGYLPAAYALGGLLGGLAAVFVLLPLAGSEVVLKGVVLALAVASVAFQWSEPRSPRRLAGAAVVSAAMLAVVLGRWWDWGALTADFANSFGQARVETAAPAYTRYLPPSFIFQHEDLEGGFTTVVEQTIVEDETARTVRTLFSNGRYVGDDLRASNGLGAMASGFVADRRRALVLGLGTGRDAADLKGLGFREIAIAEFAPGVVEAAARGFSGFNERILADPVIRLHLESGRALLLADDTAYDLIANAEGRNAASREFYRLVRGRLRPGGVYAESLASEHTGRELAPILATAASVFAYVGLWGDGERGILLAADHPLHGAATAPALDGAVIRRDDDAWR